MLKAIIFDMDGVIIDSEPQHARAALQVLQKHNAPADLAYCMRFIGSSTKNMAENCVRDFHLSLSPEQLLSEMNEAKQKLVQEEGYLPVKGVQSLIASLHKAGYLLAVASSSSQREIQQAVKALGLQKYFHKLISSSSVSRPKPAPDTFLLALERLGVSPKETLIIEDSDFGAEAAASAGVTCIGYLNTHSGNQSLQKAAVIVSSFEGLEPSFFSNVLKRSQGEPVVIADTRRLIIREITERDIPEIYRIYQDPAVRQYIDNIEDYLEEEMEKQRAYIQNVYSFYGYGLWGVYSKTSHKLIGRCGIENQVIDNREEIALSYLLDKEHWGYGYALECCRAVFRYAAEELGIERIVALIRKDNIRSLHTAQKLDMKPEKEVLYKGQQHILYVKEHLCTGLLCRAGQSESVNTNFP